MARPRFFGEHEYTVDAKGRVAIPVAFRKKLGPGEDTFFLVPGRDMTIEVHPLPGWDEYENRTLRHFPEGKRETQRVKRFLYGRGTEATLDSQGRILLPQRLRERAGITNEVVFAGVGDFFEIWEPSRYRKFMEEADKSYDEDRNVASQEGRGGGCEHGSAGADVPRTGDGQ